MITFQCNVCARSGRPVSLSVWSAHSNKIHLTTTYTWQQPTPIYHSVLVVVTLLEGRGPCWPKYTFEIPWHKHQLPPFSIKTKWYCKRMILQKISVASESHQACAQMRHALWKSILFLHFRTVSSSRLSRLSGQGEKLVSMSLSWFASDFLPSLQLSSYRQPGCCVLEICG